MNRLLVRRSSGWLAAGLMLFAAAVGAQDSTPEEQLAQARRLEKDGAFRKALAIYDAFVAQHPEHVQTVNITYRQGICYDSIGRPDEALKFFQRVIDAPPSRHFQHRAETFVRVAKLHGEAKRYAEAVDVLKALLKEGAGLYEDEAQNLCGGYYALLGNYDEAALMFNVLRKKVNSPLAREAAYKLAMVWMKAANTELARHAVEEFVQRYPAHPRAVELFMRLGRHFFEQKQFKSAVATCSQVMSRYKDRPEAVEASFILALCYREAGQPETAVEALDRTARMPQSVHNPILASEALFEAGQLCRRELDRVEDAVEFYRRAAYRARNASGERQRQIMEHSLFHQAEYHFRSENWSAAHDLYLQLREIGSELNVLGRILHCQSKMDQYGEVSLSGDSEEEVAFVKRKIAAHPGTLIALQGEVFLLDRRLERLRGRGRGRGKWEDLREVIEGFRELLTRYPPEVLQRQSMAAYIRMRMGSVYLGLQEDARVDDLEQQWRRGLALYEEALAASPDSLFRVEIMEGVAMLSQRLGMTRKAFDSYRTLYRWTGKDADEIREINAAAEQDEQRTEPAAYLRGLASVADTEDLVKEAVETVRGVLESADPASPEAREARFYLAELYYMMKRYSDAAREYKQVIRQYGPPLNEAGDVAADWQKPAEVDAALDQVYEAGIRLAHCWFTQGHRRNMREAYAWVIRNQNHLNPRVAEAEYVTLSEELKAIQEGALEKRESLAESLWKRVVNPSLDFGSKPFMQSYHSWIKNPRAVPYVKSAILKSADLYSKSGKHAVSADVYRQYLSLFSPQEQTRNRQPRFPRDEMYEAATYALGRECIHLGDFESMAEAYRQYIDGLRHVKLRPVILNLLGHYGTQGELFNDAREAYAALLDEYGPPNPTDGEGKPVPVPKEERLRPKSSWNGIRMTPPEDWDAGKVRYALGFLYWKKEDWSACRKALQPFLADAGLRRNPERDRALLMLARSQARLDDDAASEQVLRALIAQYPSFKAIEEAYVELARVLFRQERWQELDKAYAVFAQKYAHSLRRPYMDLYAALAAIGKGDVEAGMQSLRGLARADTYEDVRAEACYHLALRTEVDTRSGRTEALEWLEKSVEYYATDRALLEAGRHALELGKLRPAREYLDRCLLDFPGSGEELRAEARALLAKVAEAEAKG